MLRYFHWTGVGKDFAVLKRCTEFTRCQVLRSEVFTSLKRQAKTSHSFCGHVVLWSRRDFHKPQKSIQYQVMTTKTWNDWLENAPSMIPYRWLHYRWHVISTEIPKACDKEEAGLRYPCWPRAPKMSMLWVSAGGFLAKCWILRFLSSKNRKKKTHEMIWSLLYYWLHYFVNVILDTWIASIHLLPSIQVHIPLDAFLSPGSQSLDRSLYADE